MCHNSKQQEQKNNNQASYNMASIYWVYECKVGSEEIQNKRKSSFFLSLYLPPFPKQTQLLSPWKDRETPFGVDGM